MNRGDFIAVYMPQTLRSVGGGAFQVVNKTGMALGTVSTTVASGLKFTIPTDVMNRLNADGLVTSTAISLFNKQLDPSASDANMSRYLWIIERLGKAQVSD